MIDGLTIALPPHNRAEREYVCRYVFEERLGIACRFTAAAGADAAVIGRGTGRLVVPNVLLAGEDGSYLRAERLPHTPVVRLETGAIAVFAGAGDVIAPYVAVGAGPAVSREADTIVLAFDLLGGVFFMLTRMEEVLGTARDQHNRFPTAASWAAANGIESRPIVDEWIALLRGCCDALWPGLARPAGAYRLAPSHDIDHPFLYHGLRVTKQWQRVARKFTGDVTIRRSPAEAFRTAAGYLRFARTGVDGDPYFTLRDLMNRSERLGIRSTFYLIVQPDLPIDGRAYLEDPAIKRIAGEMIQRGHAIGLHASYGTLRNPVRAAQEAGVLRRFLETLGVDTTTLGVRHHYLRWSAPEHWAMWHAAGLAYDATLGYGDRAGFRCGTCHEFPVFDLARRQALPFRERPLVAMDSAICADAGVPSATVRERMLLKMAALADRCRLYGGTLELLWHNTHLQTRFQRAFYRDILDVCSSSVSA